MIRLPVWELALIILAPMAVAYTLRGLIERALVESLPTIRQPVTQFRMDLALFVVSGLLMALFLLYIYNFPLMQSGLKLTLGIVTVGLFAGLDLSLARERIIIKEALKGKASYVPPKELSPLTRKFSLAATLVLILVTGIMLLVLVRDVHWLAGQDLTPATVDELGRSVLIEILFVMGFLLLMVINLVFSYARNIRILFDNQTTVLENVSQGDLTKKVPVTTSDELGVIAGHTNIMIGSLREGVRMREGLLIAQEVQQHFLPENPPSIPGLDVAGVSRFSDETGGDFYDFIDCNAAECGKVAVAVGDVSGHGIGAALLMAAGRAVIRQNAVQQTSPASSVSLANIHLARDIGDTGRFMTLFYLLIDPVNSQMTWVNAGHQPPMIHDPATDKFTELRGQDIPLGVEESWTYHEHTMEMLRPDQIMLIGTDGAWEAHNEHGEMFGTKRIETIIRDNRRNSAEEILLAICNAVREFSGLVVQEDDVTMVVLKGMKG